MIFSKVMLGCAADAAAAPMLEELSAIVVKEIDSKMYFMRSRPVRSHVSYLIDSEAARCRERLSGAFAVSEN